MGVSTSMKFWLLRYLRIAAIIFERFTKVSFTSAFMIRST